MRFKTPGAGLWLALLSVCLALPLVGAAGQVKPVSVRIQARDYRFMPTRFFAHAGQQVTVRLLNQGDHPHNINFVLPMGEVKLDKDVAPERNGKLTFTAADRAGRYTFYCPVGDHRQRGMTGTLVVNSPGG